MIVRASLGTLAEVGMARVKLEARTTTAYLLQYSDTRCGGSCLYCAQSRTFMRQRGDLLGRVTWPEVEIEELAPRLARSGLKRACLQTIIKRGFVREATEIVKTLRIEGFTRPISVASTPIPKGYVLELVRVGVDRIGVGLDVASPRLFRLYNKPYSWDVYMRFISDLIEVLGRGRVTVHLIAGLGETEREMLRLMESIYRVGGRVALFAFTPIRGSPLEGMSAPDVHAYRVFQVVNYALDRGYKLAEICEFKGERAYLRGKILDKVLSEWAFVTSGCPDCNRPYYNEAPRGTTYNYPSPERARAELDRVIMELEGRLAEA